MSVCKAIHTQEVTDSKETVILRVNDSIEERRYSDESELICRHYDHTVGRSVMGVNFLTAFVETGGMRLACAAEVCTQRPMGKR